MKVTQFFPHENKNAELEEILNKNFFNKKPLLPFSDLAIDFLSGLSGKILDYSGIKTFPELVALGFWLRKSNIIMMMERFKKGIDENLAPIPRGMAFHIAPSNVDSIFLYSWALSLLIGNLNVLRISQKSNPQMDVLLKILKDFADDKNWQEISARNLIITYPADNGINIYISKRSDIRIIWGGDETVNSIKALPAKPSVKDVTFPDKISIAAVKTREYLSLSEKQKINLSGRFYSDAYMFDQMACSSPRYVFFTGTEKDCAESSKLFWKYLEKELVKRKKEDSIEIAMEKLKYMYEVMSDKNLLIPSQNVINVKPSVLRIAQKEIISSGETCGGGLFFECFLNNLEELAESVNSKYQTLTYFGYDKDELKNLVSVINGCGIDRIVPIGQALNFSENWDGYSLLSEFSKKVNILL